MKKKEKTVLAAMNPEELVKVLTDAKTALTHQQLGKFNRQIKNVREGLALRRKIAIVKTMIAQKEMHGK